MTPWGLIAVLCTMVWYLIFQISLQDTTSISLPGSQRRMQFEDMFEAKSLSGRGKKNRRKGKKKGGKKTSLSVVADEIVVGAGRYHFWWTGVPEGVEPGAPEAPNPEEVAPTSPHKPVAWSRGHNVTANAIFSMAILQTGGNRGCALIDYLKLYLGTARKFFSGDIVIAVDASHLDSEIEVVLQRHNAVVYVIPENLCSYASITSVFCGTEQEQVPLSVFKYYFYELWSSLYQSQSMVLLTEAEDVFFQSDPFEYRRDEWYQDNQIAVFQEFHPNMVIGRSLLHKRVLDECYGEDSSRTLKGRIVISNGALLGTRDAVVIWTRHLTMQVQEAPGRMVDSRCASNDIDHAFINWLTYGGLSSGLGTGSTEADNKKGRRPKLSIRPFPQGEGVFNPMGGLHPDSYVTMAGNLTGSILPNGEGGVFQALLEAVGGDRGGGDRGGDGGGNGGGGEGQAGLWKMLLRDGYVLNWNGDKSPVVHHLERVLHPSTIDSSGSNEARDEARCVWHTSKDIAVTRDLWHT